MTTLNQSSVWSVIGAIAIALGACGQAQSPPQATPAPSVVSPSASVSGTVVPEPTSTPLALASQPQSCSAPQTQAEMTYCAGQTAKQEDDELNATYQALRKELSGAREESLIDAQLAWIAFRDADCAYVASQFEGGSMQPQVVNDCIARLTSQRTAQLKEYLTSAKQGF